MRDHNSELWHKCPMKLFINTLLGWDRKLAFVISIMMTRTSETKLLKNITPCCSSFSVFCVVLLCVFTFWVPCCDVRYVMFGSSLPLIVCRIAYIRYLCLFAQWYPTQMCCVFVLVVFILFTMLPVSLDCPFGIL